MHFLALNHENKDETRGLSCLKNYFDNNCNKLHMIPRNNGKDTVPFHDKAGSLII